MNALITVRNNATRRWPSTIERHDLYSIKESSWVILGDSGIRHEVANWLATVFDNRDVLILLLCETESMSGVGGGLFELTLIEEKRVFRCLVISDQTIILFKGYVG